MPRNYVPAGRARRHVRQDMPTGMSSARVVESRQSGGGAQRLLGEQYDVPVPSIAVQTCGTSISLAQQDLERNNLSRNNLFSAVPAVQKNVSCFTSDFFTF